MSGSDLVVDLGSTRLAWRGPGGAGSALHGGDPGGVLRRALGGRSPPRSVVLGSVADSGTTANLHRGCAETWGVPVRDLTAAREALGVRNGYRAPARLGIDRWAAAVAAHAGYGGSVLVADCGTAVTVDYVDAHGLHHGGAIGAGLMLSRDALTAGTRLRLDRGDAAVPPGSLGTDTETSVAVGTLAAVAGMLELIRRDVEAAFRAPATLLITGGDAAAVRGRLPPDWLEVPGLVLDGLELLAGVTP